MVEEGYDRYWVEFRFWYNVSSFQDCMKNSDTLISDTASLEGWEMVMQLLLPALILMFWSESISADCYPATYPYKSQCEEALASDAQNYTECSTLNFTTELLICELRSPADLEALKSGRLVIPGSPVSN